MDFELNFVQQELKSSIEKFAARSYSSEQRAAVVQSESGFSEQHWQALAELGLLSLPFSSDLGGHDGTAVDLAVVFEALGSALVVEPLLDVIMAIELVASSEQQAPLLDDLMAGKTKAVVALYEPQQRYSVAPVVAQAVKTENGYLLSGEKIAVPFAHVANYLIVNARLADGSMSLLLVDATSEGVSIHPYKTIDGKRAASVHFKDVALEHSAVLSEGDEANGLLDQVIDKALISLCAEALGAMEAMYASTLDYCKQRNQFGQPIGKFQALQHTLADMYITTQRVRSLLYAASINHAEGALQAPRLVAALKAEVSRCARPFGEHCIQLHGAMGYTDELPVGQYHKRLVCIQNQFGDEAFYLNRFSALADK